MISWRLISSMVSPNNHPPDLFVNYVTAVLIGDILLSEK